MCAKRGGTNGGPETLKGTPNGAGKNKEEQEKEHARLYWRFTLGVKYMERETLHEILCQECQHFTYQIEMGKETKAGEEEGFLHYQGYLKLKDKKRKLTVKNLFCRQIHIDDCHAPKGARAYCSKEDTRVEGPWEEGYPEPIKTITELRPWQQEIDNIVTEEPDERTVHWYWDTQGGTGKTALAKYLCIKRKAMYVNGKSSDILYAATADTKTKIYIVNIARDDEHPPYKALETLKDGIWFSGKYESKMVVRNPPHVIVFANYEPDICKLSQDRWHIVNITNAI